MKKSLAAVLIIILCAGVFTGCGNKSKETVYIYNWTEYIPQAVYDLFEKETGIRVVESTFSSNEEMLAKLEAGGTSQYDLVIASNYVISTMLDEGMIQKIDKTAMKNISNISPSVMGMDFDPGNDYSIPYMTTVTVIAVNKEKCKELGVEIKSFNDLLNPALENNIVVVDDCREVIGMALKSQGLDANSTDKDTIEGTLPWLLELKKNIKAFDSDSPKTLLASNEVAAGLVYNLDAGKAIEQNDQIDVVYTTEPCEMSVDNFVITADAKNKTNAEKFIDFIHRPDVYKMILDEFPGVCINDGAYKLLDDTYLNNAGSNIDASEVERAHLIGNVGDAAEYYDDVFTQMKTN